MNAKKSAMGGRGMIIGGVGCFPTTDIREHRNPL
jgi:hypothetical protein